jgi:undecaprenyl-diphosphatase
MWLNAILKWDEKITSKLRLTDSQVRFKPAAAFFAHSGDSWFVLIGLFIIWLLTRGQWHHITALMAGGTVGLALVVLAIKFTIRRRRPEGDWGAIYRNTDPHSFPSGHAARAAMLAVIALAIGPLWLGLLLVVWGLLVCLARVWMGVHYLSDIIAGILLGILAGVVVLQLAPWLTITFPSTF